MTITKNCQSTLPVCANFGQKGHSTSKSTPCTNTSHCLHCGGDHGSDSFNCQAYSFEKEVIAAATTEKISMRAARRRVQSRYVREGVSYAQTLKTKRPSSRQVATTPSTPSPVVTTTSSTLISSTVVVPPSMVSTVNTTSITNVFFDVGFKTTVHC